MTSGKRMQDQDELKGNNGMTRRKSMWAQDMEKLLDKDIKCSNRKKRNYKK